LEHGRRGELIEQYRDGFGALVAALEGITEAELDARPASDEWTPREIVHHVADSEMTAAIRLRRLIAEDRPTISGYDEAEFARRLYYGDRPMEPSLDAVRAARATTVQILERLTPEEWMREGTHSEKGRYSVREWLEIYATHAHDHADQIRRARATAP
jgi:hypothetical protein